MNILWNREHPRFEESDCMKGPAVPAEPSKVEPLRETVEDICLAIRDAQCHIPTPSKIKIGLAVLKSDGWYGKKLHCLFCGMSFMSPCHAKTCFLMPAITFLKERRATLPPAPEEDGK
jgi:hypothetical protein